MRARGRPGLRAVAAVPLVATLALLVALAATRCGGSGIEATAADAGGQATLGQPCDPMQAGACGVGQGCDVGCSQSRPALGCRVHAGGHAAGERCTPGATGTDGCAAGATCLSDPLAGPICFRFCSGDGDCAAGQHCATSQVALRCSVQDPPAAPISISVCR